MRKVKVVIVFCLLAVLALAPYALAEGFKTSLGLGIGWAPDYEGSDDYEAVPIPFAKVTWGEGGYVLLNGNSLRVNFFNDSFQFGPILQYRKSRAAVDDNRVKRMNKIDAATEAGAFVAFKFDSLLLGVDAVADISDEYNGYLITLRGAYIATIDQGLKLTASLSTTYADNDYMNTYFQVDSKNINSSSLSYFDADACFKDVSLGLNGDMALTSNWSLRATGVYKKLLDDAKDSPLVDDVGDDNQFFLGLTAIYNF